jgi:ketosteroid isomerase-like protein
MLHKNGGAKLLPDAEKFAAEWIESWNSHDLDRILSHYAEDVEVTTPMIKVALGIESGTLRGKDLARRYWQAALEKVPDLHFQLIERSWERWLSRSCSSIRMGRSPG